MTELFVGYSQMVVKKVLDNNPMEIEISTTLPILLYVNPTSGIVEKYAEKFNPFPIIEAE